MTVTLSRSAIYIPEWNGNKELPEEEQISVEYEYLTAEDRNKYLLTDAKSFGETARAVFRDKVKKIRNLDLVIDGKKVPAIPENILSAPDMYNFFSEVSVEIITASQLTKEDKKKLK